MHDANVSKVLHNTHDLDFALSNNEAAGYGLLACLGMNGEHNL